MVLATQHRLDHVGRRWPEWDSMCVLVFALRQLSATRTLARCARVHVSDSNFVGGDFDDLPPRSCELVVHRVSI